MENKEAITYLREHTKYYEPVNREAFRTIEKDLKILEEIRSEYIVFRDGDDYFLRGGKNLYLITKKQYDKWVRWLGNEI